MPIDSQQGQSHLSHKSMEREFDEIIATLEAAIKDDGRVESLPLLEFAKSIFQHNHVGDWLKQDGVVLLQSVSRLREFVSYFESPHQVAVRSLVDASCSRVGPFAKVSASTGYSTSYGVALMEDEVPEAKTEIMILSRDMPFIVDSVRILLNQEQVTVARQLYSVVASHRTGGRLGSVRAASPDDESPEVQFDGIEAVMFLQINQALDKNKAADLEEKLYQLLDEINQARSDFQSMRSLCLQLADQFDDAIDVAFDDKMMKQEGMTSSEAAAFLRWLADDQFVFLGARRYRYKDGMPVPLAEGADIGWLRADPSVDLQEEVPLSLLGEAPLHFSKSATLGRIHRPSYPDVLRVVEIKDGQRIGEVRFVGLYTANVYRTSVRSIPILRRLADNIANGSQFLMSGYDGKYLWQLMETYPRDEWLQSSYAHLSDVFLQIIALQERPLLRVFTRVDAAYRFVSVIIYVPKDRYNTALRQAFEQILEFHLPVLGLDFNVYFSDSILARVHMIVRVNESQRFKVNGEYLQTEFAKAALSWEGRLAHQLRISIPLEAQADLESEYVNYFPEAYKAVTNEIEAARDIFGLTQIAMNRQIHLELRCSNEDPPDFLRLKIYGRGVVPAYSRMIPILEFLGFHVEDAQTYRMSAASGTQYSITYYRVKPDVPIASVDTLVLQPHLEEAVDRVLSDAGSSDHFNRLILVCGLNVAQVRALRAYARYLKQLGFNLSYRYMALTLSRYPLITRQLIKLFEIKFNLDGRDLSQRQEEVKQIKSEIENALESVEGVDDDRILRQYLHLVLATKRTNYFKISAYESHPFLVFKLKTEEIPGVPKPVPYFEIYVYSSRVEGVHLRGGPVARGGLRWSDRLEDYRTEVLGLVKAQQVKNAVIVPVGAKGGFVCKRLPKGTRDEVMTEVKACYSTFIRGLLSVTDNLHNGEVRPPEQCIRFDGEDPYLVVAADKGTATFSDLANRLAQEHDFWLGDAFASGGSHGYDHKAMGITARGAWVSVQQHFRELDINVQTDSFSVIGIGDMSGDVFGNGMLQSKYIRLLAAFNHRHIFIDPNPDEAQSYSERSRLFNLPQSNWDDYKSNLISKGGGVFSRDLKSITITPEMAECFGFTAKKLTPSELIHQLLQAKVDLIWNGGIGTYVKGSTETHLQVGDKANDTLRINGQQLQCQVIGEGGNLGLTQLARIEAAQKGIKLNTDFIDNAGGVDCSDHEVNIKILLADLMRHNEFDESTRNHMLESMTDEVATLVLSNNSDQVRALSLGVRDSKRRLGEYIRLINRLESGPLDRALEFLPDDETLEQRALTEAGLTRPELAVLLCYAKTELKKALAQSSIVLSPYALQEAYGAFPHSLLEKYRDKIQHHRLVHQIAATQMANSMVHRVGITVVQRMMDISGADIEQTISAYLVVKNVFNLEQLWKEIEACDELTHEQQSEMFAAVQRLLRRSMRLLLRHSQCMLDVAATIDRYKSGVEYFFDHIGELLRDEEREVWQEDFDYWISVGVPQSLAGKVAAFDFGLAAFDIVDAQLEATQGALAATSHLYFQVRSLLHCQWLENRVRDFPVTNQWTALAREAALDDLYAQLGAIVSAVIHGGSKHMSIRLDNSSDSLAQVAPLMKAFGDAMEPWIAQLRKTFAEMRLLAVVDHPVVIVALRSLADTVKAARDWSEGRQQLTCVV